MSLLADLGQDLVFIGFYFLPFALYLVGPQKVFKCHIINNLYLTMCIKFCKNSILF